MGSGEERGRQIGSSAGSRRSSAKNDRDLSPSSTLYLMRHPAVHLNVSENNENSSINKRALSPATFSTKTPPPPMHASKTTALGALTGSMLMPPPSTSLTVTASTAAASIIATIKPMGNHDHISTKNVRYNNNNNAPLSTLALTPREPHRTQPSSSTTSDNQRECKEYFGLRAKFTFRELHEWALDDNDKKKANNNDNNKQSVDNENKNDAPKTGNNSEKELSQKSSANNKNKRSPGPKPSVPSSSPPFPSSSPSSSPASSPSSSPASSPSASPFTSPASSPSFSPLSLGSESPVEEELLCYSETMPAIPEVRGARRVDVVRELLLVVLLPFLFVVCGQNSNMQEARYESVVKNVHLVVFLFLEKRAREREERERRERKREREREREDLSQKLYRKTKPC